MDSAANEAMEVVYDHLAKPPRFQCLRNEFMPYKDRPFFFAVDAIHFKRRDHLALARFPCYWHDGRPLHLLLESASEKTRLGILAA